MTTLGSITFGPAFRDFDKYYVGFDEQFNRIAKMHDNLTKNVQSYPPYNIKKIGDNSYTIEIAVAGFSESDIEIEFNEGNLIIKGNARDESKSEYLFNGIANRAFTRTFALQEMIEVQNAELTNGMLVINLERIVPDHKKPKKIQITGVSSKQLLTE